MTLISIQTLTACSIFMPPTGIKMKAVTPSQTILKRTPTMHFAAFLTAMDSPLKICFPIEQI